MGSIEQARQAQDLDAIPTLAKGFGFVEMLDGSDKAIAQINGRDFKGRALTVNEARPNARRDSGRRNGQY
jgi:cold-inducible RNA-binding protein